MQDIIELFKREIMCFLSRYAKKTINILLPMGTVIGVFIYHCSEIIKTVPIKQDVLILKKYDIFLI